MSVEPITPNPYAAPRSSSDTIQAEGASRSNDHEDVKLRKYAQMFIRLLGVMFIVDGLAGFGYMVVFRIVQSSQSLLDGYDLQLDAHAIGWGGTSFVNALLGSYLFFGGRWVLERIVPISGRSNGMLSAPHDAMKVNEENAT